MKGVMDQVFGEVLEYLMHEGYVKLETYFVDGTKIEANANRYRTVWRKNTERYKAGVREKIQALLDEIERVNEEEQAEYGDEDLEELGGKGRRDANGEELAKRIADLNERLRQEPENKGLAKAVRTLERDLLPRLELRTSIDGDTYVLRLAEIYAVQRCLRPDDHIQIAVCDRHR